MIATGRYARHTPTGAYVFVYSADAATGLADIRRPGAPHLYNTADLIDAAELAPITDDENIAAAIEWSIATGKFIVIEAGADLDALLG